MKLSVGTPQSQGTAGDVTELSYGAGEMRRAPSYRTPGHQSAWRRLIVTIVRADNRAHIASPCLMHCATPMALERSEAQHYGIDILTCFKRPSAQ